MIKKCLLWIFLMIILVSTTLGVSTDDLWGYYKSDEGTGDLIDSHLIGGGADIPEQGTVPDAIEGGVINGGRGVYNDTSYFYNATGYENINSDSNYSVNFWINRTDNGDSAVIIQYGISSGGWIHLITIDANNSIRTGGWKPGSAPNLGYTEILPLNTWAMGTMVHYANNTHCIWLNGVRGECVTQTETGDTAEDNLIIGNYDTPTTPIDMALTDEIGFWARPLNQSEITELYNGGLGLAYPFLVDIPYIVNSSYNMTSTSTGNSTIWRTDQTFPIRTQDTTPTITFDTNVSANCRLSITDIKWSSMNSSHDCSTTGGTSHICSLSAIDELIVGAYSSLYASCTNLNNVTMTANSTSGSLNVTVEWETDFDNGIFDENYNNISLTIDEGEDFYFWANWSYALNDSGVSQGMCHYSANNIIIESYNESAINTTLCGVGCDYTNKSQIFSFENNYSYVSDLYKFQLCHNGASPKDFHVATNCTEPVFDIDSSEVSSCDDGYTDYIIESSNCSVNDVELSIWSDGINVVQSLILVNDFIGVDRVVNESDKNMTYNASSDLWVSELREYYDHGNKNITLECSTPFSGEQEEILTLVVVNAPPVVSINFISDWFYGERIFVDGIIAKHPILANQEINITSLCVDDDANVTWSNLYWSNGTSIYNETPHSTGFDTHIFLSSNITEIGTFIFETRCNDSQGLETGLNKTFSTENLPPTASFTDGNTVSISSIPYNLTWSCSDPELETSNSFFYVNGTFNLTTANNWTIINYPFGDYNLSVSCDDSFQNSSNDSIILSYSDVCDIDIVGLCTGCKYPDNNLELSFTCSNNASLNNCGYQINEFANVTLSNCSESFNMTTELGWNTITFWANSGHPSSEVYNVWTKDIDGSIFDYTLLIIMVLIAGFMFYMGTRLGIFYVFCGVLVVVIGINLWMLNGWLASMVIFGGLVIASLVVLDSS